jgi:hypothetical protein
MAAAVTPISQKQKRQQYHQRERERVADRVGDTNLNSNAKVLFGRRDDLIITDDQDIALNLLSDTLGGPAAHLELHSIHKPPCVQTKQQQGKKDFTQNDLDLHSYHYFTKLTTTQKKNSSQMHTISPSPPPLSLLSLRPSLSHSLSKTRKAATEAEIRVWRSWGNFFLCILGPFFALKILYYFRISTIITSEQPSFLLEKKKKKKIAKKRNFNQK